MADVLDEFQTKFRVNELKILKLDHWTWSARPVHSTIGSGILSLNRSCTSFASITRDEAAELADINREIEGKLKRAFQPDKFNYVMLMMVDAHLHFHVIPRYSTERSVFDRTWKDSGWPALPALGEGSDLANSAVLNSIVEMLRSI
jgi:diadenosine tetraphosphate (Ap4A) HIT family hydrolase